MRKFVLALGTASALLAGVTSGDVRAAPASTSGGFQSVLGEIGLVENVQYLYGGRRHCWYDDGWHGPGWYWCGYRLRQGLGWGGERGWNGWERREIREERGERRERREERREYRRY
jgi:hypothetical protein